MCIFQVKPPDLRGVCSNAFVPKGKSRVKTSLLEKGWALWPVETDVLEWVKRALSAAKARVNDPALTAEWLQCEGTWFVGVDALPNAKDGSVNGSAPLAGSAFMAATDLYGELPLHQAQVSVIYPGYPRPRAGESDAGFRYRLKRDAAHVDGLLPVGQERRRNLLERHAYILGLPLTTCNENASPLVVWEGSHKIMRRVFTDALGHLPETEWSRVDLTEVYHDARREAFETCRRLSLPAIPGEAYIVHRFALHGVAPWGDGASAPEEGRMIAYFRPELLTGTRDWLEMP